MTKLNHGKLINAKMARYYALSGVVEAVLALTFLLAIPSDPKNALILGYSRTRLGMAAAMVGILLVFAGFSISAWRGYRWVVGGAKRIEKTLDNIGGFLPGIILTYALVFCGGFLIFLLHLNAQNLSTRAGVLLRLSPFVLLVFTRATQLAVVLWFSLMKTQKPGTRSGGEPTLVFRPRKITTVLASIGLLLILLSLMVDVMELYTWELPMLGFRQKVDIDREANLPTFFSTVLLLFAAILLMMIASFKRARGESYRGHWLVLSLVFLFFAVDEASVLHERLGQLLKTEFRLEGVFYYAWVVLGLIFVFILTILYLKFILDLPGGYRKNFILAMSLFFLGAIGTEMLTGWYTTYYHKTRAMDTVLTTLEETLEIGGILVLIHTLLTYLQEYYPRVRLSIMSKPSEIE